MPAELQAHPCAQSLLIFWNKIELPAQGEPAKGEG